MASAKTLRVLLGLSGLLLIGGATAVASILATGGTAPRTPVPHRFAATFPPRRRAAALGTPHARAAAAAPNVAQAIDSSFFGPGACTAYAPTAPARHLTVFLDAGHGGPDPGATGTTQSGQTIYEADETLPVELDTMAVLRGDGFRVVVSRTRDTAVLRLQPGDMSGKVLTVQGSHADVLARVGCANKAGANVLVGIYFDAGAPNNAGCVTGTTQSGRLPRRTFAWPSCCRQTCWRQ